MDNNIPPEFFRFAPHLYKEVLFRGIETTLCHAESITADNATPEEMKYWLQQVASGFILLGLCALNSVDLADLSPDIRHRMTATSQRLKALID